MKRVGTWILVSLALWIGIAAAAGEDDVERFRHFMEEGVMDPGLPAAAANELVAEGMANGRAEVVELTLKAMMQHAMFIANEDEDWLRRPAVFPNREFARIPGLRQFLIEHWRVRHRETGHNTTAAIERATRDIGDSGDETEGALERIAEEVRERLPGWPSIPRLLAVYWPGDPAVEQFLYERQESDGSPNKTHTTLALLNHGKFTSEQANSFRVRELAGSDELRHVAVSHAAKGLALSRPEYALPLLIAAGAEHPAAINDVREAVAGYADAQLALYADELRDIAPTTLGLMPMGKERDAAERLMRFVEDQTAP